MGIDQNAAQFLRHCKENGVNFENTAQIGRQNCDFSSELGGGENG